MTTPNLPDNKLILIAEDDDAIQVLLAELLDQEGYRTKIVPNGKAALDYLNSKPELPRMILLDLFMPIMDGTQFFAEFRKNAHWLKQVPVVLMSAADNATVDTIKTQLPEISEMVRKPFDLEQLLEAVRTNA